MVICNFWASVVTDNENWQLVFKINARRRFLILGTKEKTILNLGGGGKLHHLVVRSLRYV